MGDLTDHFSRSEFACQCGCGTGKVSFSLVKQLEEVRKLLGRSVTITSGVRCASHNANEGGVPNSAHVPKDLNDGEGEAGHAVDISCVYSNNRFELLNILLLHFNRIGIGRTFIHVDTDITKDPDVIFHYYKNKA